MKYLHPTSPHADGNKGVGLQQGPFRVELFHRFRVPSRMQRRVHALDCMVFVLTTYAYAPPPRPEPEFKANYAVPDEAYRKEVVDDARFLHDG